MERLLAKLNKPSTGEQHQHGEHDGEHGEDAGAPTTVEVSGPNYTITSEVASLQSEDEWSGEEELADVEEHLHRLREGYYKSYHHKLYKEA